MRKTALLALGLILGFSGWSRAGADEGASPVPTALVPAPTATASATSTPGISVKDAPYNAFGDGVHDDTAAVSMALAHVEAQGGGLFFPPGAYKITETIEMSASNFALSGVRGQSILTTDSLTKLIKLKDCSNGTFTDLSFQATTQDPDRASGGHTLILANEALISNLGFQGCSFTTPNADMDGVYFVCHSDTPNMYKGLHFTDCDFTHIGRIGAEIQNMAQSRATTQSISDVVFDNCRFTDCGIYTWGMGVSGSAGLYDSGLTVTGCTFDHVKFCAIEAMFNHVLIQGNRFINAGGPKAAILHVTPKQFNLTDFTITNNDASDSTYGQGCFLWNCSNVQLEGNNFISRGRALFLRDDSGINCSDDHFTTSEGPILFEDKPCSGIQFSNCVLSASGDEAFKLSGGTVQCANSTLNGQALGNLGY